MDNRKNKTKTAIKQAFTELLQEKSFEKITVTEITKRANIGRKTFYLHYNCIDDIIRGIEEDYTTICLNKLKKYIGNEKHDIHDIFNDVNQIILSSLPYLKSWAQGKYTAVILQNSAEKLITSALQLCIKENYIVDKDKLELCSNFYSSGLVSLYITFLKSDNISFETLKDLTYKVCFLGIDGLLIGKEKK